MLKFDIQRQLIDRRDIRECFLFRMTPLTRIVNLCILIFTLFTFSPVNCQDINQIHTVREIYRINSYKNAQIFRYFIPSETSLATWSFIANTSLNCDSVNVTVYLRYKGIPVINLDNVTDRDVIIDNEQQYQINFKANNQEFIFNLSNPLAGEYYALAYFDKVLVFNDVGDQVINSIIEKTEIFDCRAFLNSNLSFNRIKSITKLQFATKHTDHIHNAKLYEFFVPLNVFSLNVNVTKCKPISRNILNREPTNGKCPISLYLRGSGIPSREKNEKSVHCENLNECSLRHLDLVRNDINYLVIELQNSENLENSGFVNGLHVSFIVNADNCHENVQLDQYLEGIPMIMTTSTTISPDDEIISTSTVNQNLFIAKKRNEDIIIEPTTTTTTTTTQPSTTTTTNTTTTTTTTTTTPKPTTTTSTVASTTTTTSSTTTERTILDVLRNDDKILRNKKPSFNLNNHYQINNLNPTTTKPEIILTSTAAAVNSVTESKFKNIYSVTDIASASSDDLMSYAKMPKMKTQQQPNQRKDTSYSGYNTKQLTKPTTSVLNKPPISYDKDSLTDNLDLSSTNKDEKDDDEENEDEIEEDEENEEEEEVVVVKPKNKNPNRNQYQSYKPVNPRQNQYRNQVNRNNHQIRFNQARNHNNKPIKQEIEDDDEIISRHSKNRKNQNEYDFTRRNLSINARTNRISRAAWQLENSIFENELSKINFVDQCPYRIQLVRHNLPGNFNFKYSQRVASTNSRSSEGFIQVPNTNMNPHIDEKAMKLSLVQFEIVPLLDAGGNLEIELGLNIDFDYQVNNVSVIACIKHNRIPVSLNSCLDKLQVNSSNLDQRTKMSRAFIPYPKSGQWFISLFAFCHTNRQFPHHGLSGQSNHAIGQDYIPCDRQYSSVQLNIRSASCNEKNCPDKRGTCRNQLQNGIVFSYCECRSANYLGFECKEHAENYKEEVQQQLLTELLVLSLSNVLWLPVIVIAFYKSLWVESLIYILTMVLTASSHVCSSASSYSLCLINPITLEFGCLFISCLCVCITIVSLSDMATSLKCILHMFAAIWTALLIHLQWSPFWMYTCSSILFLLIMFTSWLVNCCRGSCFPSCSCWFFSIIPALITLTSAFALLLYPPILPKWITDSVFNLLLPISVLFLIYSINNRGKVLVSASNSASNLSRLPTTRAKDGQQFLAKVDWRSQSGNNFSFLQSNADEL